MNTYAINTENDIQLNEVSPGYHSSPMKSLAITLRLPSKQMHSDDEVRNNIFLPIINAILLVHSAGVESVESKISTENENLICHARFYGMVDIAAVEKDWNSILDSFGYAQAAISLDASLGRVNLKRESFYPASTFIAEY
ncbi:hypothetical protein [Emticicia sp. BO119]|uniref:hypothetical protein n=1 Tax=Emticicia sp. BO119 TaxID=2757768 RepID=UPI0015F0F535|nr:hypothetical protein [Emticicia sp. BO119]MBA4849455.1 hypothetical protein [Emticicia sp. BO119]